MKLGLVGSMSVGKTTLIEALSKLPKFSNYKVATERSKYLRDLGIKLNTDSTLNGQILFASERTSELFNDNLLTDRTILDVCAFTNLAQSINTIDKEAFETFYSRSIGEYDYIFYISPDNMPIEDNSVRTTDPEYRIAIDNEIKRLISKYKYKIKNFHVIFGSTEQRISQILELVKE